MYLRPYVLTVSNTCVIPSYRELSNQQQASSTSRSMASFPLNPSPPRQCSSSPTFPFPVIPASTVNTHPTPSPGVITTKRSPCLSLSRYRLSSLRSSSCSSLSSTSPLPYSTTFSPSVCPHHCGSSVTPGSHASGLSWARAPMPVPHTLSPRCSRAPRGESSISGQAAASHSNSSMRRR